MGTLNISLPKSLEELVDERVRSGHYSTSSEYVRDLIRQDLARQKLRGMLEAGLESPIIGPAGAAYWAEKRKSASRTVRRRGKA